MLNMNKHLSKTLIHKKPIRKTPFINLMSIIIDKHVEMFCFKFQQNRTINKEFDFLRGGGVDKGTPLINYNLNSHW